MLAFLSITQKSNLFYFVSKNRYTQNLFFVASSSFYNADTIQKTTKESHV